MNPVPYAVFGAAYGTGFMLRLLGLVGKAPSARVPAASAITVGSASSTWTRS
jgi:hypothetical protein